MPLPPNEPIPLCEADPTTFWPWLTWADFAQMEAREKTLVIVPIAGFADWGLGQSFDAEERVLMPVLSKASQSRDSSTQLLVLPPLRFVLGSSPTCAFAVDATTALGFIENVVESIKAAGFQKIVFLNASPWNEELVDAAARDLRIEKQLQMFVINLSALGLDFHPGRAGRREKLQALLEGLEQEPIPADASNTLQEAAAHLAKLFGEISQRAPLPRGGALIARMSP